MDADKRAEWERRYRDALQPKLDEPVLAGGMFYRTAGFGPAAVGPFSGLATVVLRSVGKRRAGGLPRQFLMAVTPTHVHAFGCSTSNDQVTAEEELVAWSRADLVVVAEETPIDTRVVIEPLAGGRRMVCSTGKDDLSQSVVYAMQEPVGTPAAA